VTYRELFREIMFYGEFDRMPVVHWAAWPETLERWGREGLPRDVDIHEFLGTVPAWELINAAPKLHPPLEEETIEETDEYRIFRDDGGVVLKDWKNRSCIPHYIDFTLKKARDWDAFKKRLQPHPARIPEDLDEHIAKAKASGLPIVANAGSLMGRVRNWMGIENMAYLMYDARDVYGDMMNTLADLVCWVFDQILPRVKVDAALGWEDICGRNGPLVSPHIFDECVAPAYRKIRNNLEQHGVTLYGIDSDGDVSGLVGHWLEAGVNLQFPVEVGPFKGDARALRKRYGKELRLVGNFDKLALEKGREAVEAEIRSRVRAGAAL